MPFQLSNLGVQIGAPATVRFDASAPAGAADNALIEFELNGVRRSATPAPGSGSTNPVSIAGAAAAQHYTFDWDVVTDLGTPRPAVVVFASLISDPTNSVSAPLPAPPSVNQLAVIPGVPPTLSFVLVQGTSSPCTLEVQFSADGGPWGTATPAGAPPATWSSSPTGQPGTYAWDSVHDLSPQPTTVGVRARATASGDVGAWTTVTGLPFPAVVNTPPKIVYADQAPDAYGINIRYTLADQESEPCSVLLEFSEDVAPPAVPTWTPLLPLGGSQPSGVPTTPAGTRNVFAWDARTQFAGRRYPTVHVRLTPSDQYQTGSVYTIPFGFIPNSRVQVWDVQPDGGRPLRILYTLRDIESDVCSIVSFFSVDGGNTWTRATPAAGSQTVGLPSSPAGIQHVFLWDAVTDLGGTKHPMVVFRITPDDVAPGVDGFSRPFLVNFPPSCTITAVNAGDPTIVWFDLQDQEADVCSVEVMYSLDGINWIPATEATPGGATRHLLSTAGRNHHAFAWDAHHDLGSNDVKNAQIAVIPRDLETGTSAVSSPFELDLSPNAPPALTVSAVTPGSYRAPTVVGVNVADAEADPAFLELEYSVNSGTNWHPALVATPALAGAVATSAAGIHYDLQWDAWADLGEVLASGALVQVWGRDQRGRGGAVSSAFDVDTRPPQPPVMRNVAVDPVASMGPVIVSFDLLEPEGRDCAIQALCSIDNGVTWTAATSYNGASLPGLDARPATPAGVHQYFAWDVVTDLKAASTARLQLTPSTTRTGAPVSLDFAQASLPVTQAPPPSITNAVATQAGPGEPVLVSFTAVDRSCRPVFVTVQYVDPSGTAKYATDLGAANGGSLQGLAGTPPGMAAVFAWDCATDLQGTAGTYSFLLTPQSFGAQGTPVPAAALAVDASSLRKNPPQVASLAVRAPDRDGAVELRFGLVDVASNPCDLSAKWEDPATSTWKDATLLAPFTHLQATPEGAAAHVRWNAVGDAGAGRFTGLQLSLTASNGLPSVAVPSSAFDARILPAHPHALAATGIAVVAAGRRQPVSVSVDLYDPAGEYASMELRFSVQGPADWHAATVVQDWLMRSSPTGITRGLQWDVSSDLPAGTYRQIRLEATPLDSTGRRGPSVRGNPVVLEVWPAEAQPPVATSLQVLPGAPGDPVALQVHVADAEGLPCDLRPEFSIDGGSSWNRVSLVDTKSSRGLAVSPQGTVLTLLWDVRNDLPDGQYRSVRARITAKNPWPSDPVVSPPVALVVAPRSPQAPSVVNLVGAGAANDEFQFSASLVHPRSASAMLDVRWSTDSGGTWQLATPGRGVERFPPGGFDTAPAPGAPLTWWWNLAADLGSGASVPNVLLRVTAVAEGLSGSADLQTGPLSTSPAPVGNPALAADPLIDATSPEQVEAAVVVTDPNSVPANVVLSWSTDGGNTWTPATGVAAAETQGLATNSNGQEHIITWTSRRDLAAQIWRDVRLQATCGTSVRPSASFALDLSGPLNVATGLGTPTFVELAPGAIAVDFTLTDDRSLACSVTVEFTCQERPGWTAATEAVSSGDEPFRWAAAAGGVEHRWFWAALRDLGFGAWHAIQLRLTASDGSQQAQATVTIGDRTFAAVPASAQLTGIALESRDDSVRRRVMYALDCAPPGPVDLQYTLVTPTGNTAATVIGAPDQAYASDQIAVPLYWDANADVSAALDNQPLSLQVEASRGGTVLATADLSATTDVVTRAALPSISASLATTAAGAVVTPVGIGFSINDPLARADDVLIEYSQDGGSTWLEATAYPGEGEGRQAFETADGSTSGTFVWDVERDVPDRYAKDVQVRVSLRSQPFLSPGLTPSFDIDLGAPDGHTPTSFLTVQTGAGPVVPIDVELYDPDGELVRLDIEFFSLNGAWVPATPADGSDLLTAAPAQPAGTEYRFLWDAQADAAQIFPPGAPPAGTVQLRATARKARGASLADSHTYTVAIDASPYDPGLRDYLDIRPGTLTVIGYTPQTAVGGQLLATPITLKLVDKTGTPTADAEVQLFVAPGSAIDAEIPASVFTDDKGEAQIQVRPADGTDGQLTLSARVVGAPNCQLANTFTITVKASKVVLLSQPTFVAGNYQQLSFQFGSDDPNAGMSIDYGRPVQLLITTGNGPASVEGRGDRRLVRLTNGVFPPGQLPQFTVEVVPQAAGSLQISVAQQGTTTTLFKQSFGVAAPAAAQRRTGVATFADAHAALVPVSGDDPDQHADGARWPAAGKEQWGWPGLTLTTPFRVKLLIDGQGDGPSPQAPSVTGPNVDGPPPEAPYTHNCDGVTNIVTATGNLDQATATAELQVTWTASNGTVSTSQTPSPQDTGVLSADICSNVYFTLAGDGPWYLEAGVYQAVLDPGRQYWLNTYTDASGQAHTEIHRGDSLAVSLVWRFEIQQAPVFLVYNDAQTTEADRVSAGAAELVLARVSPSAGTTTRTIAIAATQRDGSAVYNYTGPRQPPSFSNSAVAMTLQSSGKELRSSTFTFVRGGPDNPTADMLSFLRAAWVQVTALAEPLVLATDPPLRARLSLAGRPSVQDAISGTTPSAGWEGTVALSDCELVYPSGVLEVVTAFGNLSLVRTWRGHLTWERRAWMKDDESRVRQWAGAFGPGWVASFEPELVPVPDGYRFMDAAGRITRIRGAQPANGLIARVLTYPQIDDDHAPMHLSFPDHTEMRFHADGTLREIVDARGHRTRFAYDASSRLTSITDPHGRQITFTPGSGGDDRRIVSISDANGRTVTFAYQPSGAGNAQGVLASSTGSAASASYNGASQSFQESYNYEGATAATAGLVPYAQVRLKEVIRAGESRITNEHSPAGGVKTQTWNGATMKFTPAPGTTRYLLVQFRDGSEHGLTFEGGGADAAAPTQVTEFNSSSGTLRTSNYRYNSQGRMVRAELPDNLVHRWTFNDADPSVDIFSQGNLLAHEMVHTVAPPPPPPGSSTPAPQPVAYSRVESWEYQDTQNNPAFPTAIIPAESSARRTQRSWRTDLTYSQWGEVVQTVGPGARTTRISENPELFGPSPAPYTLEHKLQRPTTVVQYNKDGLIASVQAPDGIVTQYAYFALATFNSGAFSADGGGLVAQELRDTTDNSDRQFWYLDQPVVPRQTLWTYDSYGYLNSTTDSRGCQHTVAANALGLPLRIVNGIPAPGMVGQSVAHRIEYDAHWRLVKRITEQPGGTAEQGGSELAETVTEFDTEDRENSVARTVTGTDTVLTKVRRGTEGLVDGVSRPCPSAAQPKEVLSVDQREERGLPASTSLKLGRSDQAVPVQQTWDDHAAPKSLAVRNVPIQAYRGGAFGTAGGSSDPRVGLSHDLTPGRDGSGGRTRLTSDGRAAARSPKRPAGTYGFDEIRRNEWGLVRRVSRGVDARPGTGSGAPPGTAPDQPIDGVPSADPNFVGNVSVDANDSGFGPGDGRSTEEIEYDILGREALRQDDRTNTVQTVWSPGGIQLRERVGERNQLAWDDPAVPWRDERWRWQPGTDWISEVHRKLDAFGDPTTETTTLQTGTSDTKRDFVNTYSYDSFGRITSITDALGCTTRYVYDVHGEVATITDANGVLDATGTTNVDGNKTTWIRDGLGRVVRVQIDLVKGGIAGPSAVSDGSIQRKYSYTPEGQIASATDAAGFTTTWNYGPNGQLESVQTPKPRAFGPSETGKETISYDDFGQPSVRTMASGATRKMNFNTAQQLERVDIVGGSAKGTINYYYHPLGPVSSTELAWVRKERTPAGLQDIRDVRTIEYDIDSNGRVNAEVQHGSRRNIVTNALQTFERQIQFTYDGQGLRTGLTYSDQQTFRLDLDRTGRPLGVIRGKEETILRYELLGDDFVWSRRSGVVSEQRDVDVAGRLSTIRVDANGNTLVRHTMSDRDRCGRIKTWTRSALLAGGQIDETRTFTYDSAGRIVQETANYPTIGSRTVTRRFDGDGTLVFEQRIDTPVSGAATTRTKKSIRGGGGAIFETIINTNGTQQLLKTFYDLDGNVVDDGRSALRHDALGRLIFATAWGGSVATRYTYDSSNRLVACARLDIDDNETFREDYVWDGWRLTEVWRDDKLRERYVYGRGLSEVVRAEVNGVAWFPVYGPDGSVDGILNDLGSVVESYAYDLDGVVTVFDDQRRPVSRAPLFRFGFHGHYYDPVTKLVYMRERWYSPESAQCLEPDPLGAAEVVNLYAICVGDPINQNDPYGLLTWGQWAGIGAAVVTGLIVTAVTGGAGAGLAAVMIAGALSGAMGEVVEAAVDNRPTSLARIGFAAGLGAVTAGLFKGAGTLWFNRVTLPRALAAASASQAGRTMVVPAARVISAAARLRAIDASLRSLETAASSTTTTSAARVASAAARLGVIKESLRSLENAAARAEAQTMFREAARTTVQRAAGRLRDLTVIESSGEWGASLGRAGRGAGQARVMGEYLGVEGGRVSAADYSGRAGDIWFHLGPTQGGFRNVPGNLVAAPGGTNIVHLRIVENSLKLFQQQGLRVFTRAIARVRPGTHIAESLRYEAWVNGAKRAEFIYNMAEDLTVSGGPAARWLPRPLDLRVVFPPSQ